MISWTLPPGVVNVQGGITNAPYVYVVDSGNNRVEAWTYQGDFVFSFGSFGNGNGQFNSPYGICFDGTYLYVTDSGNARVQVFDAFGNYISQFGTGGTGLGQFDNPKGIAADSNFVYVVDSNNDRFEIFTKDGTCIFALGSYGSGVDEFNDPTDCSVDEVYLYITDTGNSRIVAYPLNFGAGDWGAVLETDNFDWVVTAFMDSAAVIGALETDNFDWTVNASISIGDVMSAALEIDNFDWKVTAETGDEADLIWDTFDWNVAAAITLGQTMTASLVSVGFDWAVKASIVQSIVVNADLEIDNFDWKVQALVLSGSSIDATLTWSDWNVSASISCGQSIPADLVLDNFDWVVEATITPASSVSAVLAWELFDWSVEAIISVGSAVPSYSCIVMNIQNKAVTQYTQYPFNSFCYYRGRYFAAMSGQGIFELKGDTDNGNKVTGKIKFRVEDMDADGQKHKIREAFLTGNNIEHMKVSLEEDEGRTVPMEIAASSRHIISERRYKAPRGLRGRFYACAVESSDAFNIDKLRLMDEGIPERIR